jgi:muramidase (phage lysozyme)
MRREPLDATISPAAAVLLDFIRETETGRLGPESYRTLYGHNQDKLSRPITEMTVGQIQSQQREWSRRFGSSATGGYQFMRATLSGLIKELSLNRSQVFDADLQDRLGHHLLRRRGYDSFVEGRIDLQSFAKNLAKEWASLPVLVGTRGAHRTIGRGQSYYAGDGLNKALVPPEKVEKILAEVLSAHRSGAKLVPVPLPRPEVEDPENLDKPMSKSKTVWMWLSTAVGAPIAAFSGLDWRVQLAIIALIVGFAVYGIYARHRLARIYRELKEGLA